MMSRGAHWRLLHRDSEFAVRYSFIVADFHHLLLAGFTGAHKTAT